MADRCSTLDGLAWAYDPALKPLAAAEALPAA
jgi:hypothetical protein